MTRLILSLSFSIFVAVSGCTLKHPSWTEVIDGYTFKIAGTEIDNPDEDDEFFYAVTFPDGETWGTGYHDDRYKAEQVRDKMIRDWIERQKTLPGLSDTVAGPPKLPANVPPDPKPAVREVDGGGS